MAPVRSLTNVHPDFVSLVANDTIASELASALVGIFDISSFRNHRKFGTRVSSLFCKPSQTVTRSLLLERQVLALVVNYTDLHARTITIVEEIIAANNPQLDPGFAIVIHADKDGDGKLRNWGKERNITILPIYRHKAGALPSSKAIRQYLATELFSSDPFQVTGPVALDIDFFGRREEAKELLRQLLHGRLRAIFGIRKVGKTSVINRILRAAREESSLSIAMIDCSVEEFYRLDAQKAINALARTVQIASSRGYAHISEGLSGKDRELSVIFDELWKAPNRKPIVLVFDEVDYITPASPTAPHWAAEFNDFWRKLRVVVQEAQRQNAHLAMLISGVSSKFFRQEQIHGAENSALHFIPEEYLSPFARGASEAMIADLGRRCGLHFSKEAKDIFAQGCGDFPYWIRMMGSYCHKVLDVDARPIQIEANQAAQLLEDFSASDGQEIVRVALEDLGRKYPEILELLRECATASDGLTGEKGRLLIKYGLASLRGRRCQIESLLVRTGIQQVSQSITSNDSQIPMPTERIVSKVLFEDGEWAEELALINKRRNMLERRLRDFIRFTLKARATKELPWPEQVLSGIAKERRSALGSLSSDQLMSKLFWKELSQIVIKLWDVFQVAIQDKKRFEQAMELLNDRFDAHAKDADAADLALQRRELAWLEERVLG